MQFLTRFYFKMIYRLGALQGKVDALSQCSYLTPRPGELAFDYKKQVLLGPTQLYEIEVFIMPYLHHVMQYPCSDMFAQQVLDHNQSKTLS